MANNKEITANKHNQLSTYFFAKACANAIIHGNIHELQLFLSINIPIEKRLQEFAPIKKAKRECGFISWVYDKDKSIKIQNKHGVKFHNEIHYDKIMSIIFPGAVKISADEYNEYLLLVKAAVNNNKEHQAPCPISLGVCRCKFITKDISYKQTLNAIRKNIITDDEIRNYINKNPEPQKSNKFGEPQSKYRHGTYGLHGMEINYWRR